MSTTFSATADVSEVVKIDPGQTVTATLTVASGSTFDGTINFELAQDPLFAQGYVTIGSSTRTDSGADTIVYVHDNKPGYVDVPVYVRLRAGTISTDSENSVGVIAQDESLQVGLWDDLTFPMVGVNPPGQTTDPDIDPDTGLPLFDKASVERLVGCKPLPHGYHEGSELRPHVHARSIADPNGTGVVQLFLEYKWYNATDALPAAYTEETVDFTLTDHVDTDTPINQILSFSSISGAGKKIGSFVEWRLSRLGDETEDTYDDDMVLMEVDFHFLSDSLGSFQETVK